MQATTSPSPDPTGSHREHRLSQRELAAWLRLLETPGVGRESARKLLGHYGSANAIFEVDNKGWEAVVGVRLARALARPSDSLEPLLQRTTAWLAEDASNAVLVLGDTLYPRLLLEAADPPLLLYAKGDVRLLQRDSLAVVGSRNPTPQGAENARAFSQHLSAAGFCIVSGLALGVDAAAHEGALAEEGSTIAVVGTGLDRVYPSRHRPLAQRIAQQGLMLSEFALGTPPLTPHFPVRNRLIAGLSRGTLVVEAALQSGSLITARLAAESGREVFAIPGSIHSPQSRGCHALIKQGAKLVETAQDVLEEIAPQMAPRPVGTSQVQRGTAAVDPLIAALGHEVSTLDQLCIRTGWDAAALTARLFELELEGQVAKLPGMKFQVVAGSGRAAQTRPIGDT